MVDNPAIHELNNIEVRGGDTDFQVVNIAGTSEDILLEYNDATDEWDIRGTVSDLDVADLEYEFGLHQTEINEDREIPEGQGSVIAGPLTGTGEITGEGNLAVVDDVQDAVRNPVQENVDFNSNNATGISALEAESVSTEQADNADVRFWDGDGPLQTAIDDAKTAGYHTLVLPSGNFDGGITIPSDLSVIGQGIFANQDGPVRIFETETGPTVTLDGNGASISGVDVRGNDDAENIRINERFCVVRGVSFTQTDTDEIVVHDDFNFIQSNYLRTGTIRLESDENSVLGNVRVGSVIDNGADNEVLGNT